MRAFDGARPLPAWQQDPAQAPVPPHTEASLARPARIEDLRMASAGSMVLFATRPSTSTLKQITDQSTSPEFHPGLFNGALPIDAQRALDVVSLMDFWQRAQREALQAQPKPQLGWRRPGGEPATPAKP